MAETNPEAQYGEDWAPVYDEWFPFDDQGEAAVTKLVELAAERSVLELAIGSGRLAVPLAARGLRVEGVDASPAMVEMLHAKPGGAAIPVTMGNLRDVPVRGEFGLVFIAFSSLFALLTQEDQVACFENVAAHLVADGCFVVEAFVPDHDRLGTRGRHIRPMLIADDEARFHLQHHDSVRQQVHGQTVSIGRDGRARLFPTHVRYAWPSELDLMARLAGLRLRDRWGGWAGQPFTAESGKHVTVYERVA